MAEQAGAGSQLVPQQPKAIHRHCLATGMRVVMDYAAQVIIQAGEVAEQAQQVEIFVLAEQMEVQAALV